MELQHTTRSLARLILAISLGFSCCTLAFASEIQGFTEPYQDIDVAASETGVIKAILVKEGDRVSGDELLVRLDDELQEVTLSIAEEIKESRGRLESANEELQLQRTMLSKLNELRLRHHASLQEIERAKAQVRIAEARLKATQEELDVKELEHRRAQIQLERRRLRSPIDGVVTKISKDLGESVNPADPVVLKVVQLDTLLVVFLVPADQTQTLQNGSNVTVRIPLADQMASGIVEFVSPTTDPQSGLTRVRVRIPNQKETLPCGVTCYLVGSDQSESHFAAAEL